MIKEIKKELKKLADKKYKEFSSSLIPNIDNILGVRLPELRKIAKRISKDNWQKFIQENDDEFFELTMLEGMIIGNLNLNFSEYKKIIANFICKINSWSICDSFVSSLKIIKEHKDDFRNFIQKYSTSNKEYESRFYYVVLLNFYINTDIDFVLKEISKFNNEQYYSKMAVAWCLSICIIENFNLSLEYIKSNKIQPWVLKKGITKAIESYRLTINQKEILKTLRKSL